MLTDEPLMGNWHTDGVCTASPANASWQSWASIESFQAATTIEYLSSHNIGKGGFVNSKYSMSHFATSKVAILCWGMCWSALDFGCGAVWSPPDLGCSSACVDSAPSDLDNLMRRANYWQVSSGGGGIDTAGFREFGSGSHAITVLAWLHWLSKGTLVGWKYFSWCARCRSWTYGCWSKSSSSIFDHKVDPLVLSIASLPISWLVSSVCFFDDIGNISDPQSDAQRQIIGRQTLERQWILVAFLTVSALSRGGSWFFGA